MVKVLKGFLIATVALGMAFFCTSEASAKLTLKSKTLKDGKYLEHDQIYNGIDCGGKNISPDLYWSNPPKGTKSYAVIVHSPDAQAAGGWYYWLVFNIPSVKKSILTGEILPYPVYQTATSYEIPGYCGPCPPVGSSTHKYVFTLYALDVARLRLHEDFRPEYAEKVMLPHVLEKASITTYYRRR